MCDPPMNELWATLTGQWIYLYGSMSLTACSQKSCSRLKIWPQVNKKISKELKMYKNVENDRTYWGRPKCSKCLRHSRLRRRTDKWSAAVSCILRSEKVSEGETGQLIGLLHSFYALYIALYKKVSIMFVASRCSYITWLKLEIWRW